VSFDEGRSLNIQELDGASNNSVEDIRNLIDQVSFAPQLGTHKVYILDEVHMLSSSAFNAFLKTLEEPPKHAIFILATTEKHKIIPTILSRCQIFDFNRIKIDDISSHLADIAQKENVAAEEDGLHIIAQKADGALRDALSMFDQIISFSGGTITYKDVIENLNILDYDYYFKVTNSILSNKIGETLLLFNEVLNNGFDGHNFINGLAEHIRNLLVCQDASTIVLLEVGATIKDKYLAQAKASNTNQLVHFLNITTKSDTQYKASKNQRLLVEVMLMQLCSIDSQMAEKKKPIINLPLNHKGNLTSPKTEQSKNPALDASLKSTGVNYSTPEPSAPLTAQEPKASLGALLPNKQEIVSSGKPTLKRSSTRSFSNSISINPETKKQKATKEVEIDITNRPTEDFSNEAYVNCLKNYKAILKEKGKDSLASIFEETPELKGNTIYLRIENKALNDEFDVQKSDFLDYIRKELSNYDVEVKFTINKDFKTKKAYTPQEKFTKMSENNPQLKELVKTLNMDVGYA
jgi:DNA polymerase-3 subunit gamma/tau